MTLERLREIDMMLHAWGHGEGPGLERELVEEVWRLRGLLRLVQCAAGRWEEYGATIELSGAAVKRIDEALG